MQVLGKTITIKRANTDSEGSGNHSRCTGQEQFLGELYQEGKSC